ncbi:MAG: hypothetical protein Q7U78_05995 [Gallionella sp.]|nr:hypothetical protein [Gallionella sp.]
MKNTLDFVSDLKTKTGLESDYAIAKLLGVTKTTLSSYRNKKSFFDDSIAIQVADLLNEDAAYVVACIHAERAKHSNERALWERIAAMMQTKEASGIAAALLVLIFLPTISLDDGGFNLALSAAPAHNEYYVK